MTSVVAVVRRTSSYSVDKATVETLLDRGENRTALTVARLRPTLVFQHDAGREITRYLLGPLVPARILDGRVPVLPWPVAGVRGSSPWGPGGLDMAMSVPVLDTTHAARAGLASPVLGGPGAAPAGHGHRGGHGHREPAAACPERLMRPQVRRRASHGTLGP